MQNKLSLEEINNLGVTYVNLKKSGSKVELMKFEKRMISQLDYLILSKLSKYKPYKNYQDLVAESWLAFAKCLSSFNPEKGNFAKWFHRYIDTAISRKALQHSIVQIPLRKGERIDLKMSYFGLTKPSFKHLQNCYSECSNFELNNLSNKIFDHVNTLSAQDKNIIIWKFGLNGEKPKNVKAISEILSLSQKEVNLRLDYLIDNLRSFL